MVLMSKDMARSYGVLWGVRYSSSTERIVNGQLNCAQCNCVSLSCLQYNFGKDKNSPLKLDTYYFVGK